MSNMLKNNNGRLATGGSVLDQLFNNKVSRFFDDTFWGFNGVNSAATVPVNIRETDKTYEMELVAPGLRKEDFKLNVSEDTLTISLETSNEKEEQSATEGWLRREYQQRSFSRSFQLGENVDINNIAARYENGMLQLVIPKNEKAQPLSRSIPIQ